MKRLDDTTLHGPRRLACMALALAWIGAGCAAGTPGAQPHDMSIAGHESMAAREDTQATGHTAQYDPKAAETRERCGGPRKGEGAGASPVCWTSSANPTDEHRREAEAHTKMAADHRAAAQALRDAEAQACAGIPAEDRDTSPFYHREDIVSVEPIVDAPGGKPVIKKDGGAVVVFRAVPGLTAEWLQRVVDCHIARNGSFGHEMPEMAYCPLASRGVTAKVTSTGNGFAVAIRSDDPASAQEVLRRSQALVAH